MTAYLIVYGKDPSDRFAAYQYPNRNAAREASLRLVPAATEADHGNGGGCAYVIERPEDITLSGTVLVAVYNALTNANLKKFETRAVGVERLLKHLPEFARVVPASDGANATKEKKTMENVVEPKKRGRKPIEGRMTLREQMDAYNVLATEAKSAGIEAKIHTSTFEKYENGEKQMQKLREKIAEARKLAA